jgi:hypothetical protein
MLIRGQLQQQVFVGALAVTLQQPLLTPCSASFRHHLTQRRSRIREAFPRMRIVCFCCSCCVHRLDVLQLHHLHSALALPLRPASFTPAPLLHPRHFIR